MKDNRKIFLGLGLLVLLVGMIMFFSGSHDLDVCQNIINLENYINLEMLNRGIDYNIKLYESSYVSDLVDLRGCYIKGLMFTHFGFIIAIFGAFVVGKNIK